MKLKFLLVACMLLVSSFAMGQAQTTVTATIVDQNGIPYANCTWTATFIDGPLQSGQSSTFVNDGTAVTPRSYAGGCNASGVMTYALWSNTGVLPSGSKWKIAYCDSTGVYCSNATTSVTGTTQDLSGLLSGVAKPLAVKNYVMFPGVPTGACGDTQTAKNQATGDLYTCLNNAWHLAASGATGSVSSCSTAGALGYYASSGTTISCPTTPATVDANGNITAPSFTGTGSSYIVLGSNPSYTYVAGSLTNNGGVPTWGTGAGTSTPICTGAACTLPAVNPTSVGFVGIVMNNALSATGAASTQANRVFVFPFILGTAQTITHWSAYTVTGASSSHSDVCIYSSTGTTGGSLLASTGGYSTASNSTYSNGTITQTSVTLQPGNYYLAWTSDSTTVVPSSLPAMSSIAVGVITNNNSTAVMGYAANAATNGVCPATLGNITSSVVDPVLHPPFTYWSK